MVQGGTTNPTNSDKFIENVVKYISKRKDLLEALKSLLQEKEFIKSGKIFNESTIKNVSELLIKDKNLFGSVMNILKEYLEKDNNQLKTLLKQVNKVEGMEKELETLGNQLLAQGLISGAAVTTLTGALAGLLTVGGVTGALIIGGAAFVGFMALVAIAAIGYLIYQNRGEIKEGVIDTGKVMKSFVKDVIDELTWEKTNFSRLEEECICDMVYPANAEELKEAQNKIRIIKMLKNEEQRSAIQELVKNGTIQNFSEADMIRLLEKGLRGCPETSKRL